MKPSVHFFCPPQDEAVAGRRRAASRAVQRGAAGLLRVTKKAKLPRVRFHDLRHSHATDLLAHGEHPKVVSERLGHYDPASHLRVYSHVLPGCRRRRQPG